MVAKLLYLASFSINITCVLLLCQVLSVTPVADPILFQATGVSLGLLGVITKVTLQCEDAFNLLETRSNYPLHYCLQHMSTLAKSADHVKFWIELNTELCTVYSANRTSEDPRDHIPQPLVDIMVSE